MEKGRKRRPWLAALLNAVSMGAGFLYLGRFRLAVAYGFSVLLIFTLSAWTRAILVLPGLVAVAAVVLGVYVFGIVAAAVMARRQGEMVLARWQRWYVYVAFTVAVSLVSQCLLSQRATLYGYETFRFPSGSMADTLLPGDFFTSDTWAYDSAEPQRGDLVVFRLPSDETVKYVKRTIGLPGERIEIRGGAVLVNGVPLSEPYLNPAYNRLESPPMAATVPEGSYFVLGDNRDHSNDSRYWGMVPREKIVGNVRQIWMSYEGGRGVRWERLGIEPK